MAAGVGWRIDNRSLVSARVRAAAASALGDGAEHLLEVANRTVPIEEGTLGRSGTTKVDDGSLRAAVGYDTPYAARQHEEMTYQHDAGRRAKWLEATFKERSKAVGDLIADRIRDAVGR